MKVPSQVTGLLEQEMDRKEFLKHVGAASLVVLGAGSIIKSIESLLGGSLTTSKQTTKKNSFGYGSSVYGGKR